MLTGSKGGLRRQRGGFADIAMCMNNHCPSRTECYRFMAVPDPLYQSYADFQPDKVRGRCEDFWSVSPKPIEEAKKSPAEPPPE